MTHLIDPTIPRLGMGCWAIGGPFWNEGEPVGYSGTDDASSKAALSAARDVGIRVFDTAAVYGTGHSETLLGEVLGKDPDAIILTKFGHAYDPATRQMFAPQTDCDAIRASVRDSLARLRRERIDVLLLHVNELPIDAAEPVFETLETLREAGQIGAYGWSTDFPDRVEAFGAAPGFQAVEHLMNTFFDAPEIGETCARHDLVQLIRSPLGMGVLTGSFDAGRVLPREDIRANGRHRQRYFTDGRPSADVAVKVGAIREILCQDGRTLAQGALCWLLAKSPRILPLPGARNAEQIIENAGALDFGPLPPAAMDEIERVLESPQTGAPLAF